MDINLNILVIRFDGSVYKVKNGTGVFRFTRIYFLKSMRKTVERTRLCIDLV